MTDWYSAAREADGRTDEEIMAEIKYRADTGAGTPLREAIKADLTALAHLTPEDWAERPGADPIARTINAARDIVDARFDAARRATGPAGLDVEHQRAFVNFVRLWWRGPNGFPVVPAGNDSIVAEDYEDMVRELAALGIRLSVADGPGPA